MKIKNAKLAIFDCRCTFLSSFISNMSISQPLTLYSREASCTTAMNKFALAVSSVFGVLFAMLLIAIIQQSFFGAEVIVR